MNRYYRKVLQLSVLALFTRRSSKLHKKKMKQQIHTELLFRVCYFIIDVNQL